MHHLTSKTTQPEQRKIQVSILLICSNQEEGIRNSENYTGRWTK